MFSCSVSRAVARVCLVLLLFAQITVSAYACSGPVYRSTADQLPETVAMSGCEEMAAVQDVNVCHDHCQAGDRNVGAFFAPVPSVSLGLLAIADVTSGSTGIPRVIPDELLARHTGPPLSIRFSVFRI